MKLAIIELIEISDRSNCWMQEFTINELIGNNKTLLYFVSYPDIDFLYGRYLIYQYYFN